MDFKGWWKTGDQKICEPFTVQDAYSRYLLYSKPVSSRTGNTIWAIMEKLFSQYGVPERFRSDNGSPFASGGIGNLSPLSIRLVKAGITPEWIRPGKPQDNGKHERMHRVMKEEIALDPAPTLERQTKQLEEFRIYYNEIRPHDSLQGRTPSKVYKKSFKDWNGTNKMSSYSDSVYVRKVSKRGQVSIFGHEIFLSERLYQESIGFEKVSEELYKVYYGPIKLGEFCPTYGFLKS